MSLSKKEKVPAFELSWELCPEEGALELVMAIEAFEEVYVSDRLWDYDKDFQRVPDPFGVYRFAREGELRLVFAQAPRPPNLRPRVAYHPMFSRVKAGETHRRVVSMAAPVQEYSPFARDVGAPAELLEVSRVSLLIGHRTRASLDSDPEPPVNETAEEAGYIVRDAELVVSSMAVDGLRVLRRTGYIPRFALPGEPPPEPYVRPAESA